MLFDLLGNGSTEDAERVVSDTFALGISRRPRAGVAVNPGPKDVGVAYYVSAVTSRRKATLRHFRRPDGKRLGVLRMHEAVFLLLAGGKIDGVRTLAGVSKLTIVAE